MEISAIEIIEAQQLQEALLNQGCRERSITYAFRKIDRVKTDN